MSFPTQEGKQVPDAKFVIREDNQFKSITSDNVFKGKNVIVFSLPGAFTPTCSSAHVPGYEALQPVFKDNGIDDIVCIAVNDGFVMSQWAQHQNASRIRFLADGNGEFSEKIGSLADFSQLGFGKRSLRYSMLVKDKKIAKMFIEPQASASNPDPFLVSDAETMLKYINPEAKVEKSIVVFSKNGCSHCKRAKDYLNEKGWQFSEITVGHNGVPINVLKAVSQGKPTTPQIYIDGKYIGGADELLKWNEE